MLDSPEINLPEYDDEQLASMLGAVKAAQRSTAQAQAAPGPALGRRDGHACRRRGRRRAFCGAPRDGPASRSVATPLSGP